MIIKQFHIKKTKRGFKVTFLNWFNDYVFLKNENDLNKLYKISNEYNIKLAKDGLITFIKSPMRWK